MPTVPERLVTLDERARELRSDVDAVLDLLNGGGSVEYTRSVRGRLHTIETTLSGMVLRRSVGLGMLRGWQSAILVACGIATVAAAWYGVLAN
jgi:hypothetical protein